VPAWEIFKLFSYILPAFLEVTVPMALLLAILVGFGRLSSDSAIVALFLDAGRVVAYRPFGTRRRTTASRARAC